MTAELQFDEAQVLITGGGEGIGRGLAARFRAAGARVLVTGRTLAKLEQAARDLPGLEVLVNDISRPEGREALADQVRTALPSLNILINNAGVQRRIALAADDAPWAERQAEIDTLLSGPIHLNHLLVPMMLASGRPSLVVNVTSGGAFIPQPFAPVYSACKAALHSYTMTLRHALAGTSCRVVEVIPPAVRTALAGPGASHGAPLAEFCDEVFAALRAGEADEIGFGVTESVAFREPMRLARALFEANASRFPIETYVS
jgi:uncharacterized oxidoreductase